MQGLDLSTALRNAPHPRSRPRLGDPPRACGCALACAAMLVLASGCGRRAPVFVSEVMVASSPTLPAAPTDAAWEHAPVHQAGLLLQDLVDPRLLQPSTGALRVQALSDGAFVAFRLEWDDPSVDDTPGPARFSDACAVQLPLSVAADVPAPQMGEAGKTVEIAYWRAAWQAVVDGRADEIQALYPGVSPPHYPFDAQSLTPGSPDQTAMDSRYAPARALGNTMAGPREQPVEDLIAEGPGTIHPAPRAHSKGRGERSTAGWAVVITRPLPEGLRPGARTQVAFAVWQGAMEEAGARKMRSAWVPMVMEVGS